MLREDFLAAMRTACAVVTKSPHKSLLECVRLGSGELAATDLISSIRIPVDWRGEPVLLEGRAVVGFLAACEGSQVEIVGGSIRTELGESLTLKGFPVEDWPVLPEPVSEAGGTSLQVPSVEVRRVLDVGLATCARKPGRYAMNALRVRLSDGGVAVSATDGRRLALASWGRVGDTVQVLLPSSAATALTRILPRGRAVQVSVSVALAGDRLSLRLADGTLLTAVATEGEFPRVDSVIPRDPLGTRLVLDVAEARRRLKLVRVGTTTEARAVSIAVAEDGAGIVLTAGRARAELRAVEVLSAPPGSRTAVNVDYLDCALDCAGSPTVSMGWENSKSPARIDSPGLLQAIMPIMLDS